MSYILSIDQGTTSTRAILFDKKGKAIAKAQQEVKCLFPHDGWVEEDPYDILSSAINVINDLLLKFDLSYDDIDSLAITNQRETTIVWDKKSGKPVYNAIVRQSRQTYEICEKRRPYEMMVREKTGLLINPYFSASKIRFILDYIKDGQKRAENGELLFGTVDTWLMYKLSNGEIFKTDASNASRTMLFNIKTLDYDEELLKAFAIPRKMLPEVASSSGYFGNAKYLNPDLKIMGVAGDQEAALFGQNCFEKGECKNTYGTGCFMLMNIGEDLKISNSKLITTIAWKIDDRVTYALEGSVFVAGASVQWLRDSLRMIKTAYESERYAKNAKGSDEIYLVPAFTGLGAPYWDDKCRGAIFGLTRATSKEDFIRATLNSIALQSKDVIVTMEKDSGVEISSIKADGGATANNYLMAYQADILNKEIILPSSVETTALGAAYLAGLASGYWKDIEDIRLTHKIKKVFRPKMSEKRRKEIDERWNLAVKAARVFE
jgi:glycerol kinase